jgi:DNA-binding response OmpR family regulator
MNSNGRILLADDEETFRRTTADLLRDAGYQVEVAADADGALQLIADGTYDLVISDLEMPGNDDLRLVREVATQAGGVPVIIITGFPSTESAIASIGLPVAAYLLKPVAFDELLGHVQIAVARFRSYRAMRQTEERLGAWHRELQQIEPVRAGLAPDASAIDAFLALTLRNVMGSLTDLTALSQALNHPEGEIAHRQPCQILNCPRGQQLQSAIRETVDTLEETKGAFKSKTLASLRRRLELLLDLG